MNARMALLLLVGISAHALADEPSEKFREAMQGTWTIQSFTADGKDIPAETLNTWRRIVAGDHVTWKQGEEVLLELDMKFDTSAKPMTLDSTMTTGDSKGQTLPAIFELKDDELRVCFGPPDKPRPSEFASPMGSGLLMFTAKRTKP